MTVDFSSDEARAIRKHDIQRMRQIEEMRPRYSVLLQSKEKLKTAVEMAGKRIARIEADMSRLRSDLESLEFSLLSERENHERYVAASGWVCEEIEDMRNVAAGLLVDIDEVCNDSIMQ